MGLALMLAEARMLGADEWDLIRGLQGRRGIIAGETVSMAQVALARWMLGNRSSDFMVSRIIGSLSEDQLIRFVTGETEPDFQIANVIADKTKGAVTPPMWARRADAPDLYLAPADEGGVPSQSPASQARAVPLTVEFGLQQAPEFGAMLNNGELVIIGPDDVMRVPAACMLALFNQMGSLLAGFEGRPSA